MHGIKFQLPSRGKYGETYIGLERPKLYHILEYLQAGDNSIIAKNEFIKSLCNLDLGKYPVGDREYLFTEIRTLIGDSIISGTFPCEKDGCTDTVAYVLDLKTCIVDQLPEDFVAGYELEFPICKITKAIDIMTVEKEELLEEYVRFYETSDKPLINADLGENLYEVARYACLFRDTITLKDIDDNIVLMKDKFDWTDFEMLIAYDIAFPCGPRVLVNTECDTCGAKYRMNIRTDSSFFQLNIEGLLRKHKFLAKMSNIGFKDFMEYTVSMMNTVVESEVQSIKEHNQKIRSLLATRRK